MATRIRPGRCRGHLPHGGARCGAGLHRASPHCGFLGQVLHDYPEASRPMATSASSSSWAVAASPCASAATCPRPLPMSCPRSGRATWAPRYRWSEAGASAGRGSRPASLRWLCGGSGSQLLCNNKTFTTPACNLLQFSLAQHKNLLLRLIQHGIKLLGVLRSLRLLFHWSSAVEWG